MCPKKCHLSWMDDKNSEKSCKYFFRHQLKKIRAKVGVNLGWDGSWRLRGGEKENVEKEKVFSLIIENWGSLWCSFGLDERRHNRLKSQKSCNLRKPHCPHCSSLPTKIIVFLFFIFSNWMAPELACDEDFFFKKNDFSLWDNRTTIGTNNFYWTIFPLLAHCLSCITQDVSAVVFQSKCRSNINYFCTWRIKAQKLGFNVIVTISFGISVFVNIRSWLSRILEI